LAIDERRIHRREDHVQILEKDYWNGPPLSDARLDDPNRRGPEILEHRWPEDADPLPWDNTEQASIRTTLDGARRTIEIEELARPTSSRRSDYQLVRYAHAIRDIERHAFIHLDGAVRYYTSQAYESRRQGRWAQKEDQQPTGRRKVFRVDGELDTAAWTDLVALWFHGNQLVVEALAGLAGDANTG
jgi:hypothetical protein